MKIYFKTADVQMLQSAKTEVDSKAAMIQQLSASTSQWVEVNF